MSITYSHENVDISRSKWLETALALVVPPLEVWRLMGWSREFWLNLALTLTAYFPGVMHAVWISERENTANA